MNTTNETSAISSKKSKFFSRKIILIVIGVVVICCIGSISFGAYLSNTPEGKMTSTAETLEKQQSPSLTPDQNLTKTIEMAESTNTLEFTMTPVETNTPEPTQTIKPTDTPLPTPTPVLGLVKIGTHIVGKDIQPGIYWGMAGDSIIDTCYWAKLNDLAGELDSIIANDNALGQYYVEVEESDYAFETHCELISIEYAPFIELGDEIPAGTYLVGRDIQPGTYQGEAGEDILESCYWARLRDVTGGLGSIIANDNGVGSFYIQVSPNDFALDVDCSIVVSSE